MSGEPEVFGDLGAVRLPDLPCHVAVGMFDGVHRGHRAVIEGAIEAARNARGIAGVLTFWPHPSRLFRPEDPTRLIFDAEARRGILLGLGARFIIEQHFDREFAAIEAGDFVARLRRAMPRLHTLYVGENWRFGRGRRGDVPMLVGIARVAGVNVVSVERLKFNGHPVSSTRIRALIEQGDVANASELLGFPYFARGKVVPGRRIGRTIGVPTLNLDWQPDLRPALGVYAVTLRDARGGPSSQAVANYGVRPTTDGGDIPVLEAHVLGSCAFGEGDTLQVDFLARLRSEQRFESLDELRAQIARDRESALLYFAKEQGGVRG